MWPRWKIVVLADADRGNDGRVMEAMLKMGKMEIALLRRAYDGGIMRRRSPSLAPEHPSCAHPGLPYSSPIKADVSRSGVPRS